MTQKAPYRDQRSEFFKSFFDLALPYNEYLNSGSEIHQSRWRNIEKSINFSSELQNKCSQFKRKLNVIVMSGIWCGDCARQGPILKLIEDHAPGICLRFIDNKENPTLQEELRINGAEKVPVVLSLSEDFFELNRFGDCHLSVYQRKALDSLGPACASGIIPPSGDELTNEVNEWVSHFERIQILLRLSPMLRKRYSD